MHHDSLGAPIGAKSPISDALVLATHNPYPGRVWKGHHSPKPQTYTTTKKRFPRQASEGFGMDRKGKNWSLYSQSASLGRSSRLTFPSPDQPGRSSRSTLSRSSRLGHKLPKSWPSDINTKIVTKIVPMRAVNMPIGAFCIFFWRKRFCDDDFLSLPQPIGRPKAGNWVCHSRWADRLHQPMEPIGNSSRLADWSQPIGAD